MLAIQIAAVGLALTIFAFALIQWWMVQKYCHALWSSRKRLADRFYNYVDDPPAVAVVVCMRGDDPSLHECLLGLAQQEYPDFLVFGVVDNDNDPAVKTFAGVREEFERPPILVTLPEIPKQRTLKCSALLHAFMAVGDHSDQLRYVALLDSDVKCDPNWLADLVAPFQDAAVGATTGNRWYAPDDDGLGSWMRQVWNAAAVVQMWHYQVAWGGSLAFRTEFTKQEKFLAPLRTGFCEDTGIARVVRSLGFETVRVPGLIMNSTESTTVRNCFTFITRQLLTTKLYHPGWPLVVLHGLLIPFYVLASLAIPVLVPERALSSICFLPILAVVVFQISNLYLLHQIGRVNLAWVAERSQEPTRETLSLPSYLAAVLLIQFVHAGAVIAASFKRVFAWRQIQYRVKSGNDVAMLKFRPFKSTATESQSIE